MTRLEKLSVAIGQLNPASSSKNSPSHSNGGGGMDSESSRFRILYSTTIGRK